MDVSANVSCQSLTSKQKFCPMTVRENSFAEWLRKAQSQSLSRAIERVFFLGASTSPPAAVPATRCQCMLLPRGRAADETASHFSQTTSGLCDNTGHKDTGRPRRKRMAVVYRVARTLACRQNGHTIMGQAPPAALAVSAPPRRAASAASARLRSGPLTQPRCDAAHCAAPLAWSGAASSPPDRHGDHLEARSRRSRAQWRRCF